MVLPLQSAPDTNSLRLLSQLAELVSQEVETDFLIEQLLKLMESHTGARKLRILLPEETGNLTVHYASGLSEKEISRGNYGAGEGVTGQVLQYGKSAVVQDIETDPVYIARITPHSELKGIARQYVAVPIKAKNCNLGVLAALVSRGEDSDSILALFQVVSAYVGQLLFSRSLEQHALRNPQGKDSSGEHMELENRSTYGILGQSTTLKRALHKARRAAGSDAPIMLTGESGTGKERFARMIHLASDRRDQPFVCLNCASIPVNLLESELFGHEKGSFTGATSRHIGKFEMASGGTLFLDEIGEMDINLQAKLLRVLQEQLIHRVGSTEGRQIDIRIVTATNRNLESAVQEGSFRMDLYYRLNVIRIHLPALRERGKDIRLLTNYFLMRENQRYGRNVVIDRNAMKLMENYPWPGNVRQLENFTTRAVVMTDKEMLSEKDIQALLAEDNHIDLTRPILVEDNQSVVSRRPYQRIGGQERSSIEHALKLCRGNKTAAAEQLGMSARQLHYRIRKLGLQ